MIILVLPFISSMSVPVYYKLQGNNFWLSPKRCLYWEEQKAVILSDLHFGKTGHFRKSGIGIPQNVFKEDIQCLIDQISSFNPQQLIIVGDLFHSEANKEIQLFEKWRKDLASIHFHLIKGNHDILKDQWYQNANIQIHQSEMTIGKFRFVHDINSATNDSALYSFTGHIHPGIRLNGIAKQSLRFPCFYFGKEYAVLPDFSRFTGLHLIEPKKKETVIAIADDAIIQMQ